MYNARPYTVIVIVILGILSSTAAGYGFEFDPIRYPDPTPFTISQARDFFWQLHQESERYHMIADSTAPGSWESYGWMGNSGLNNHRPLIRCTAERVLAYLQAYRVDDRQIYLTRAQQGLEYLLSQQDPVDGNFVIEQLPGYNYYRNAFPTAMAGRALVEGYRFFGDGRYLTAAEQAADWQLAYPQYVGNQSNVNYYGLVAWHLASVYEEDGNLDYLNEAVALCDSIMMWQDYTHGTDPVDDTWYHDPLGVNYGVRPSTAYEKRMVYHALTLRGLLETYHAVGEDTSYADFKSRLEGSITRAINYMIDQQVATGRLREWKTGYGDFAWVSGLEALSLAHEYLDLDSANRERLESLIFAVARNITQYLGYGGYRRVRGAWRRIQEIVAFAQYLHSTVSGTVYPGMVWEGTIRITGDVTVPEGVTLTISPGATVVFSAGSDDQHSGLYPDKCELAVYGTLNADGVVFRSSNTTDPTNADWEGITVRPGDMRVKGRTIPRPAALTS